MALDLSRPYGTSLGTGSTHKYLQDDKYFDSAGNEVTREGKPVAKAAVKAPAPAPAAAPATSANAQAAAQ